MNAKRRHRMIPLLLAAFLCTTATAGGVGFASEEEPASPMNDPEAYIQSRYEQLIEEFGPFRQWSLEQKAAFNQLQIALGVPTSDDTFIHGVPGEDDLPWYTALSIAREAFEGTFGLTVEALDGYAAQYTFNIIDPDNPIWKIELLAMVDGEPASEAAYTAYVLSRTGEVAALYGPDDTPLAESTPLPTPEATITPLPEPEVTLNPDEPSWG